MGLDEDIDQALTNCAWAFCWTWDKLWGTEKENPHITAHKEVVDELDSRLASEKKQG